MNFKVFKNDSAIFYRIDNNSIGHKSRNNLFVFPHEILFVH